MLCQLRAQRLRQIGHFIERACPLLVKPLGALSGAISRLCQLFELRLQLSKLQRLDVDPVCGGHSPNLPAERPRLKHRPRSLFPLVTNEIMNKVGGYETVCSPRDLIYGSHVADERLRVEGGNGQ